MSSSPTIRKINPNIFNAAKGGGILTFGKIIEYLNRFILAFLIARIFGAEQYGLYSLALSAAALVSTVGLFGLDDAIMRYVAVYHGQRDDARLWGVLQFCLITAVGLTTILSVFLYFLAEPIAVGIFQSSELIRLIRLVSFITPFLSLSEMLMFASQGFKKMQYSVIAEQFIQLPLRVIIILILMKVGLDPFLALVIFGFADIMASIALIYFINKEFPLRRTFSQARWEVKEITTFAFPFWISDLLNTMRGQVQTILLGSLSTIASVGIFTIVDRVNLVSKMAYRSILTSTKPIIADLQAKDDWYQVGNLYTVSSRWGMTMNLPIFLVLVIFPRELLSLFGASFQEGALALTVLAIAELVNTGTGVGGVIIDMTGQNRMKLFNSIFQVVLSVGTNVILIHSMGLMGAAIAALISVGLINVLRMVEVYWLFRLLPYDRTYLKPFTAAAAAMATAWLFSSLFPEGMLLVRIILGSLLIAVVFLGVLLSLGLPKEEKAILVRARQQIFSISLFNRFGSTHQ